AGIPTWSPTVVLICRSTAYVWQSGRDAQFSADCGRMCLNLSSTSRYSYAIEMLLSRTRKSRLLYRRENSAELSILHEALEVDSHTATATKVAGDS
ncbi:hypothetical protein KCU95_g19088, partial [Aureobasidium melanogenum]